MDMGIAGWKRKPAACKINLIFVHHLFGKCYYGFIHNNFSEGWSFIRYFYAYVCGQVGGQQIEYLFLLRHFYSVLFGCRNFFEGVS